MEDTNTVEFQIASIRSRKKPTNTDTIELTLSTLFEISILVGDSNKEVFDNLEIITIFNKVLDRGSSESLAVDLGQLVTSFEFDFFVTNIENFGFNITTLFENQLEKNIL